MMVRTKKGWMLSFLEKTDDGEIMNQFGKAVIENKVGNRCSRTLQPPDNLIVNAMDHLGGEVLVGRLRST
jgi:hypothetical protein